MPSRRRPLLFPALLVLVILLAALLPVDEAVHDFIFRHAVSHEVRLAANGFTLLGTTWAGAGLLGVLAVGGYRTGDVALWRAGVGGLAGLALGGLTVQVVKYVVCRARPRLVEGWGVGPSTRPDDSAAIGFFHWPCLGRRNLNSFPSGHATTAFTVAVALTAVAPGRRRLWLGVASGIGVSRVALNAHFLSDVVGGGLIGWWAGQVGLDLVARLDRRTRRPSSGRGPVHGGRIGSPAV
ncbi:MAG TPA: phosphatase PAP2 family protein [Methylomirabilota bacterium]|nr:phosphatase PAP2 family protein [Methylomirabilota bacterium]